MDGTERAIALDEQTGEVLWTREWPTTYRMLMGSYAIGPRATPTVGTDQWSYEWQVPDGSGTTTILSRASDDSVNLETPGEDVTVTYGRPAAAR